MRRSVRALPRIVAQTAHGTTVEVEIARDGKRQVVKVMVGRLEENEEKEADQSDAGPSDDKSNELTAIPELLALIDVRGCVVTIDAGGCYATIY